MKNAPMENRLTSIFMIPFHDWRKIQMEGFRTRDAHLIEAAAGIESLITVIINRPTTLAEIYLKRKPGLIKGQLILKKGPFSLYKIKPNLYLIDYVSRDFLGQAKQKFNWFLDRYDDENFKSFIRSSGSFLGLPDNSPVFNQNVFAAGMAQGITKGPTIFDAWDNFLKFHVYESIRKRLEGAYSYLSINAKKWTTNSRDNIEFFSTKYQIAKIELIPNGVDLKRFQSIDPKTPDDLNGIPRPIAGFGGKITQLLDTDLLNEVMERVPEVSFVFVGQKLDRGVYERIRKLKNFYYLGDKHYDVYPEYVQSFDICIIPYVLADGKKSGANTIKVYEYLSTGKKIVGTRSNGLEDLEDYVYAVTNAEDFANELNHLANEKPKPDFEEHTWEYKMNLILELLYEAI